MIKDNIKKYFIAIYSSNYFWSYLDDKYNVTKDVVIGHVSGLVGVIILFIVAILAKLNIINLEHNLKEYRIYLLVLVGIIGYLFVIKPIEKYIKKNIPLREVEIEFKKGGFTKKNTFKFLLWQIFGFAFLLIITFLFIKYIFELF